MLYEKIPKQFPVRVHDRTRLFAKPIQVLEHGDSQKLPRVNRRRTIEIIQPAHLPRELWACQDPATSQSADAVNLSQAACHHELWPETEGRARRSFVDRIEINFIYQHERANAARDLAYFAQGTQEFDTYIHDMLAVSGGANVFGDEATRYPQITLEQVAATQAEVILLPDEPYRFRRVHEADFAPFSDLPAVRDGRIHLVDGKLLSWYGPRIAQALEILPPLLQA